MPRSSRTPHLRGTGTVGMSSPRPSSSWSWVLSTPSYASLTPGAGDRRRPHLRFVIRRVVNERFHIIWRRCESINRRFQLGEGRILRTLLGSFIDRFIRIPRIQPEPLLSWRKQRECHYHHIPPPRMTLPKMVSTGTRPRVWEPPAVIQSKRKIHQPQQLLPTSNCNYLEHN